MRVHSVKSKSDTAVWRKQRKAQNQVPLLTYKLTTFSFRHIKSTIISHFHFNVTLMGLRFSSSEAAASESASPSSSLGELPESCVAQIMTYMDPPQICKLATLNRAFRGASSADFVWESKLPPNYDILLRRIFADFPSHLGKRGIYARLCRLNSLDDGTKVIIILIITLFWFFDVMRGSGVEERVLCVVQKVWLDRGMGKLCLCVSAKGLSITGIDDRRNWNHIPTDESR